MRIFRVNSKRPHESSFYFPPVLSVVRERWTPPPGPEQLGAEVSRGDSLLELQAAPGPGTPEEYCKSNKDF